MIEFTVMISPRVIRSGTLMRASPTRAHQPHPLRVTFTWA